MLKGMKNFEMEQLTYLIRDEQKRRADKRILNGNFSPLNDEELSFISDGEIVKAAVAYRRRVRCTVTFAYAVVKFVSNTEEQEQV
jgi:hypothetical protein